MSDFDQVMNFQVSKMGMRGRVVRLSDTLDKVIGQHNYPDWVGFQLAEMLLLNAAMGSSIKLKGVLSLQARSKGVFTLIATDYVAPEQEGEVAELRGYVKVNDEKKSLGFDNFAEGILGIIIDQKTGGQPYQGMTSITGTLSESAQYYFDQSEQIPTRFHVELQYDALTEKWRGGLIMVQRVAGEGGIAPAAAADMSEVEALLGTMTADELLDENVTPAQLVYRLFHEQEPTANAADPLAFGCSCSEDRVRNSLSIYSAKDIAYMTTDDGKVTADCQFCGAHYVLDPATVGFEAEQK